MENNVLRIRIISFKDSAKQNINNILCYIKKLTNLPSNTDSTMILAPSDTAETCVCSVNETFDWRIDDGNYCQLVFLTSKSRSKAIADIILWFNYLFEYVTDPKHNKEYHTELLCTAMIRRDYQFEFTVQLLRDSKTLVPYLSSAIKQRQYDKISSRQSIRGHLMKLQQFNHPVHCAICHGFIWGLHHQGFECSQCFLVTHKKCNQHIPFWCRRSLFPEPPSLNGSSRINIHIPHTFKQHDAPFVRALVTRNHGHCNHCGSAIFRNALKCTQLNLTNKIIETSLNLECHFIIHEHCQPNVPPMCTIPYNSMAEAMADARDLIHRGVRIHYSNQEIEVNHSRSSSFDISWLDPLPEFDFEKHNTIFLPKIADFEYIGRVGDGAFAQVYCVQHISSKQYLAVKVADGKNDQARQQLEVEKQILFRYSRGNPYMIKAYCTFHQGSKLFLVMELVQGGTLYHKIQTTRMNEDEIRFYLAEIICVLQYLHSNNIVYRDLKLEHAVVCTEGHIRVVDYGLGRLLKTSDETCHTFCGTYSYMAPEVQCLETKATKEGYSYPVDFWALGIMFFQMLSGELFDYPPQSFSNTNEETNESKNIVDILGLPRHASPEAYSCIYGLLENDPKKRLGSPDSPHGLIRNHPFFKAGRKIDWENIDEGVFKSMVKHVSAAMVTSDASIYRPLATLSMDRGSHGKAEWIAAGQSTCTLAEDEQFKSFDYINQSSWLELIQSDV
ncbi:unnamed protein product [Adineta steineri]|uniref:protein kinase C n=2 Tax=Adineta steineri TaxID=433720 RepID=A0A813PN58_9BILA|nr:unnamed protein product [Adineta steineri]CAF3624469.1 unnamed protein product [Adineta steineri]